MASSALWRMMNLGFPKWKLNPNPNWNENLLDSGFAKNCWNPTTFRLDVCDIHILESCSDAAACVISHAQRYTCLFKYIYYVYPAESFIFKKNNDTPDAHWESVDILVELIEKADGLNDHVVGSVHVEFHLRPRVAVTKTKLGLTLGHIAQTFHQPRKVKTNSLKTKTQHTLTCTSGKKNVSSQKNAKYFK